MLAKWLWLAASTALWSGAVLAQDAPPAMPMGAGHDHQPAVTPSAEVKAEGAPDLHQAHGSTAHTHDDTVVPLRPTLLTGYGVGGFAITTGVPQAQAFFSNGLELGAAFAHPAAVAAMQEAVRLDPACGMCKWGQALVDGPTINYGKDAKERVPLLKLAREGQRETASSGTPREQALTAALVKRYEPGQTHARDLAYAKAMRQVQATYPQDNEIAVLTADALLLASYKDEKHIDMNMVHESVALLEDVLRRAPDHTPAIHFYIHATEFIDDPARAEPYANRLAALAPRASHLVHMPSHTFYWVGRYQDAADANRMAVQIGEAQAKALGTAAPKGVWGLPYHMHNVIFGMGGALMAGDAGTALELARPMVAVVQAREGDDPISQLLAASGYYAIARFDPKSVATLPEPKGAYLKAAWHYARGEAAASAGDSAAVRTERAAIPDTLSTGKTKGPHAPEQMLGIMRHVLDGRAAMLDGKPAEAAAAFTAAAEIEETRDFNQFSDPPAFWYPVRRDVAAAKLAAGDSAGAVIAAEASLKLRPRDPVALATLAKAKAASPTS